VVLDVTHARRGRGIRGKVEAVAHAEVAGVGTELVAEQGDPGAHDEHDNDHDADDDEAPPAPQP